MNHHRNASQEGLDTRQFWRTASDRSACRSNSRKHTVHHFKGQSTFLAAKIRLDDASAADGKLHRRQSASRERHGENQRGREKGQGREEKKKRGETHPIAAHQHGVAREKAEPLNHRQQQSGAEQASVSAAQLRLAGSCGRDDAAAGTDHGNERSKERDLRGEEEEPDW